MQLNKGEELPNPLRVVLVDDRVTVRESLRTVLTLEDDIEVVGEAQSGREAVEVAYAVNPDIVLMDFEMPDAVGEHFDGIEACREIKSRKLAQAVIILTVHGDQQSRHRAYAAGCDLFLEKGINTAELLHELRRLAG